MSPRKVKKLNHRHLLKKARGNTSYREFASEAGCSPAELHLWETQNRVPEARRADIASASLGRVKPQDFTPTWALASEA